MEGVLTTFRYKGISHSLHHVGVACAGADGVISISMVHDLSKHSKRKNTSLVWLRLQLDEGGRVLEFTRRPKGRRKISPIPQPSIAWLRVSWGSSEASQDLLVAANALGLVRIERIDFKPF